MDACAGAIMLLFGSYSDVFLSFFSLTRKIKLRTSFRALLPGVRFVFSFFLPLIHA